MDPAAETISETRKRRGAPRPVVAVVGLGLIGGSLARALSAAGYTVLGVDRETVTGQARRARAIARAVTFTEAADQAGILVLAAPPAVNTRWLARLKRARVRPAIVTDVGSVKGPIVRQATHLGLQSFVGGHPMAGSASSGFKASEAGLFEGRAWALTPLRDTRVPRALRRMVWDVGARPVVLDAAGHDRAVAFLSHLPQLLSWALAATAAKDPIARRHRALAGPGFRDMTRLARSPRPLWRQILGANRAEVRRALAMLARELRRKP